MSTYPSERWPSDALVEALDGTTDAATGLPYIAKGVGPTSVPTYEVQYNRREQRLLREIAPVNAGRVVDEGGLKIGVYPIDCTIAGQRRRFAGATGRAVTDNATTHLWLDADGTLQSGTAFPPDVAGYLPLAKVVAANGNLTITDERPKALFAVHGRRVLLARTQSDTDCTPSSESLVHNDGAGAAVTLTLGAVGEGAVFTFVVAEDAQELRIDPGDARRFIDASDGGVRSNGAAVRASDAGAAITVAAISIDGSLSFVVISKIGSWTYEA